MGSLQIAKYHLMSSVQDTFKLVFCTFSGFASITQHKSSSSTFKLFDMFYYLRSNSNSPPRPPWEKVPTNTLSNIAKGHFFLIFNICGKVIIVKPCGKNQCWRVSEFYDTRQVQFSQSNLQKGPLLPIEKNSKISSLGKGINIF
jgi:hypothetical protein